MCEGKGNLAGETEGKVKRHLESEGERGVAALGLLC